MSANLQPVANAGTVSLAPKMVLTASLSATTSELLHSLSAVRSGSQEDGKPLSLRAEIPSETMVRIDRAIEYLTRNLGGDLTIEAVEQGLFSMRNLGGHKLSKADAKQQADDWESYFLKSERPKPPASVFLKVCTDFGNGDHGDFFPLPKKVHEACFALLKPFQAQLHDLRRYQAATVEPAKPTEAEYAVRKERVSGLFKELPPSEREAHLRKKWPVENIKAKYWHLPANARMAAMMADIELEHRLAENAERAEAAAHHPRQSMRDYAQSRSEAAE